MSAVNFPAADFTPQLAGYTGQGAFRFWCQKVLPIVYDDSLSYYELLNKVVVYLNNVISDVSVMGNNINEIATAFGNLQSYINDNFQELVGDFNELQQFVNDYFDNLDITQEISNKLDQMALDGSLTRVVSPIIPDIVTDWMNEHITPTSPIVDNSLTIEGAAADAKITGLFRNGTIETYDSTKTYNAGDYCRYGQTILRCISTNTGAYNPNAWEAVIISDELSKDYHASEAVFKNYVTFEHGTYSDSGAKRYQLNRLRSVSPCVIGEIFSISVPSPFGIYAQLLNEDMTVAGFYGFNGGRGQQTLYSSDFLASRPNAKYFNLICSKNNESVDLTSYCEYVNKNLRVVGRFIKDREQGLYKLSYGTAISANTDMQTVTIPGTYYCSSGATAQSLVNCPTELPFRMVVEYSSGNDENYIVQKYTDVDGGQYVVRKKINSWFLTSGKRLPSLNYKKKALIYRIHKAYYNKRNWFVYDYNSTRNDYADNSRCFLEKDDVIERFPSAESYFNAHPNQLGCYKTNCSDYLQLLMMGRAVTDFTGINDDPYTYSADVNLFTDETYGEFDFGYYFDFNDRLSAYKKYNVDGSNRLRGYGLYGYQPDSPEPYSYNSFYSDGNTTKIMVWNDEQARYVPLNQSFNLFMTASDMALELYRKGCEIELPELEVGDLVFTKKPYNFNGFDHTSYRNIGHVLMVIQMASDGTPILSGGTPIFGESTWAWPTIVDRSYNGLYPTDLLYSRTVLRNCVMCARNPSALGLGGNVPDSISVIPETEPVMPYDSEEEHGPILDRS